MITINKTAICLSCKNNPLVYQPSIENENEWLMCDKFPVIPIEILQNKQQCEFYKMSDVPIIGKQSG